MDVRSYVIERGCRNKLPSSRCEKGVTVFEIGATYPGFTVLSNMRTVFSREEEFGGNQLLDNIMSRVDVSEQRAIEIKLGNDVFGEYTRAVL